MRHSPVTVIRIYTAIVLLLAVFGAPVVLATLNRHPVPTAYATTASGPSAAVVVYDNALGPNFTDGSFAFSAKNACDTSVYYSPPCSYAIAYSAWGALNFQVISGSLNTSAYTNLEYKLNPGSLPMSDFSALLVSGSGDVIKEIPLSAASVVPLGAGWNQVTLSLEQLNPSHLPVAAIQLKSQLNTELPAVHYDDVAITGYTGGPAPFSTPGTSQVTPGPAVGPTPAPTTPSSSATLALLPGQKRWAGGVSSFLFGANDTEEWSPDNVETDPHHIIQSSMKAAHFTLGRTFIFHYSLANGHRTTIGRHPVKRLSRQNSHLYDRPIPAGNLNTGRSYEVETRIKTLERMGMQCLVVFPDIWTTPTYNSDPNPLHQRIIDPATKSLETDLDFARKVVAYLGKRCNLYEIGNEPDLDQYTQSGATIHHMDIKTYVERWGEFVRALRTINPKAKFIGPVTYNDQGNDCGYSTGSPFSSSKPGDCYMQGFLRGAREIKVPPDAVSFHWYPCSGATLATCTAREWESYAGVVAEVRGWIQQDLGHMVPVGITEWNFDPGSNTALASDTSFMSSYTSTALSSMISAHLDFAVQFDIQSFSGYGALDMFDLHRNDEPKSQFRTIKEMIQMYRSSSSGTAMSGRRKTGLRQPSPWPR